MIKSKLVEINENIMIKLIIINMQKKKNNNTTADILTVLY